jgi:hypothetical protein
MDFRSAEIHEFESSGEATLLVIVPAHAAQVQIRGPELA